MMRKLFVFLLLSIAVSGMAETIRDVFKAMPDSLMPYLTTNNRLDMIDFMDAKMKAEVTNKLDGESEMLFLSDDSLSIKMSDALTLELKVEKLSTPLPHNVGATHVLRMKRVYHVSHDRTETILTSYDTKSWKVLSTVVLSSTLQRRDEEINNKKQI